MSIREPNYSYTKTAEMYEQYKAALKKRPKDKSANHAVPSIITPLPATLGGSAINYLDNHGIARDDELFDMLGFNKLSWLKKNGDVVGDLDLRANPRQH